MRTACQNTTKPYSPKCIRSHAVYQFPYNVICHPTNVQRVCQYFNQRHDEVTENLDHEKEKREPIYGVPVALHNILTLG